MDDFLANIMAGLETVDEATNNALVVFLVHWGRVSRGLKKGVLRWGGGVPVMLYSLRKRLM